MMNSFRDPRSGVTGMGGGIVSDLCEIASAAGKVEQMIINCAGVSRS